MEIRFILLFHYINKGINTAYAHKNCAVYGQDKLSKETTETWFCCFHFQKFAVKDAPRSG